MLFCEIGPELIREFLSNRIRKSLAFGELFCAVDQAHIDLVRLRNRVRRRTIVEIVQHRLNRHTRLILEHRHTVQVARVRHCEIKFRPVHV